MNFTMISPSLSYPNTFSSPRRHITYPPSNPPNYNAGYVAPQITTVAQPIATSYNSVPSVIMVNGVPFSPSPFIFNGISQNHYYVSNPFPQMTPNRQPGHLLSSTPPPPNVGRSSHQMPNNILPNGTLGTSLSSTLRPPEKQNTPAGEVPIVVSPLNERTGTEKTKADAFILPHSKSGVPIDLSTLDDKPTEKEMLSQMSKAEKKRYFFGVIGLSVERKRITVT